MKKEDKKVDENILWKKYGIHKLCKSCKKKCKQHSHVEIYNCPNYVPK